MPMNITGKWLFISECVELSPLLPFIINKIFYNKFSCCSIIFYSINIALKLREFYYFEAMNIYQRDYRQTPEIFTLISEHRNEETKRYLQKHRSEIHLKGWMDHTPLHVASESGNVEMVKYLIENGADVN